MRYSLPQRLLVGLSFIVLAAGCGGKDKAQASPPAPATSSTTAAAWNFPSAAELTAAPQVEPAEETLVDQPEPNDPALQVQGAGSSAEPSAADSANPADINPCTLVTADEWAAFAGPGGTVATPLEDGAACGFIDASDQTRLAVAALRASDGGYLSTSEAARGTAVSVAGSESATWLTAFPVPASSTLVVKAKGHDIVIEVSSRGGKTQDQLRDAAISFGGKALERLP